MKANSIPTAVLASMLLVPVLPAMAGVANLTVETAQPTSSDQRVFLVAREDGDLPGDPDRFKVKGDLWVRNNGSTTLTVDFIELAFPGSGLASDMKPPLKGDTLPAGGVGRMTFQYEHTADLPLPLPANLDIILHFAGRVGPASFRYPIAIYENDTPSGSHFFPMAEDDLAPGLYWRYWDRHINGSTGRDRYAYDFDVVRWSGSGYTGRGTGESGEPLSGENNSDFLAFGLPVYAVSDGQVIICTRGKQDQPPGEPGNGGGNELWIQHGDEVIRYSHFRQGSMPSALCPFGADFVNVESMNIFVEAGDKIGEIGNSGQTTGPHLHISIHYRPDPTQPLETSFDRADSRPLNWHNIDIASSTTASVNSLGGTPSFHPMANTVLPSHTLIRANPCGLIFPPKGRPEISHIAIRAECHQDVFNLSVAQGYGPVFVDGYAIGPDRYFNSVFRPSDLAWVARHDLLLPELGSVHDELTTDGYRLHQVDSYPMRNGAGMPDIGHAVIYQKRSGPAYNAYFGLNEADFATRLDRDGTAGLVPIQASATEVAGNTYWSLLTEDLNVQGWGLETVPHDQFEQTADFHEGIGEKPLYVHGFRADGVDWLTGIWIKPRYGPLDSVHDYALVGFFLEDASQRSMGKLMEAVTGYNDGLDNALFAGIWRGVPLAVVVAAPVATAALSTAIEFVIDPLSSAECSLNGSDFEPCTSPVDVPQRIETSHEFRVRATGRDGSLGPTSVARWRVDRDVVWAAGFEYGMPDDDDS